jgi:hypothetical protein
VMKACAHDHFDLAELLINHGAEFDSEFKVRCASS